MEEFCNQYYAILDQLREKPVIVLTPLPMKNLQEFKNRIVFRDNSCLLSYCDGIRKVAKLFANIYLGDVNAAFADENRSDWYLPHGDRKFDQKYTID